MKGYKRSFWVFMSVFLFFSCEKGQERMENYLVEFATVIKENSKYHFKLDNGRVLIPDESKQYSGEGGQRVILNYTPLEGDAIKINSVSNIFTGTIQEDGFPQNYSNDPVKIQSVWVSGEWLNLIMEIEYFNVPHKIALLRDYSSRSTDLYFSHSSNNDPPGYPKKMYASFFLSDLRGETENPPIPFRLFINSHSGIRLFELELQ